MCIANAIGITAPNAEPADTPKIDGSAKGFLNIPCITAPEIDKANPTKNESNILGSLISKTTDSFIVLEKLEVKRMEKTSETLISITPFDNETADIPKEKIKKIIK